MNLSMSMLFLYMVTGAIGFGYMVYGYKQTMMVALATGVALSVYPYFIESLWLNILIGMVLVPLPWIWRV